MSDKSSIHIRPITSGSEQHNKREKELKYVRSDLSYQNSSYEVQSISDAQQQARARYEKHVGQKMQAKANPIREGVLLISEHHTADDLKRLANRLEQRFGIRTIQAYCHKDEGHYDKNTKEWKPNYHAHMVFDWTDKNTGKSLRLRKDELRDMQTIVAEELELVRGIKSGKKHIESSAYKLKKVQEELQENYQVKNLGTDAFLLKLKKNDLEDDITTFENKLNELNEQIKLRTERAKYIEEYIKTNKPKTIQFDELIKKSIEDSKFLEEQKTKLAKDIKESQAELERLDLEISKRRGSMRR